MSIIVNPDLLPAFMTADQVGSLCQIARRTVQHYCRIGIWRDGEHWTRRRRSRLFYRDAILKWLHGQAGYEVKPTRHPCRADLSKSPALAAALEREAS